MKVMKSKVKYIEKELSKKDVSQLHHNYYLEEMMLVNEICLKHGKSHEEKGGNSRGNIFASVSA